MAAIPPHSTIGILGGGQLGRMLSLAAAQLGYRVHIFSPEGESPAAQVSAATTVADYEDWSALEAFAKAVDVVTLEFENIPVATLDYLAARKPVHPGAKALRIAQDRLFEKDFLNGIGARTAPYAGVSTLAEAEAALLKIGTPAVLKTRRFGYDGKGQALVREPHELAEAWESLNSDSVIVEGFVRFSREISVIAARGQTGEIATYAPIENRHKNHILDVSIAPASIPESLTFKAEALGRKIIEALDYVGVLAVELFSSDEDSNLLVNEIAPRVHNSGHWTIEAAATSQFEQHIRAVCGLPLGLTTPYGDAVMTNLIGDDIHRWLDYLAEPGTHFHHYGKAEAKPGRKMGHITRVYPLGSNRLAKP
jgi:5-(carboxyamino)imidazole ribonucleotide synthase